MRTMGVNKSAEDNSSAFRLIGEDKKTRKTDSSELVYGIFDDKNKGVNGEIDEEVFQGNTGDCWLISGVLSLANTESGSKLISDSISINSNGDYEVNFKGVDKKYTISKKELNEANNSTILSGLGVVKSKYSTGDDDMLLIELALQKLVDEGETEIETIDGLNGGSAYYLYELFSDNEVEYAYGDDEGEMSDLLDYYQENQEECNGTIGVELGFSGLADNHAYAVKSYDGETMSLINPWNTTEEVEISAKDLYENMGGYDFSVLDATA